MGRRSYEMTKRAESVQKTRLGILQAAEDLFSGPGFSQVSVGDVADKASVTRPTIYHQFGSRSGLIEALIGSVEDRAGYRKVLERATQDDPARALIETAEALIDFVARSGHLFGNLRTLAHLEPELATTVARKEAARRHLFTELIDRVSRRGSLAVPIAHATAALLSVTRFEAVQELLTVSDSPEQAAATIRVIVGCLISPAEMTPASAATGP